MRVIGHSSAAPPLLLLTVAAQYTVHGLADSICVYMVGMKCHSNPTNVVSYNSEETARGAVAAVVRDEDSTARGLLSFTLSLDLRHSTAEATWFVQW
jgi:hypothetical protein